MHACILAALGGLLVKFTYSFVQNDVICYKKWYFETPRPAPRKCPPADFFSYFECCGDSDGCCRRLRVELLKCPPADFFSYFECCGDSDGCCRRLRNDCLCSVIRNGDGVVLLYTSVGRSTHEEQQRRRCQQRRATT
ncbi:hypothetical protein DICVIV_13077 [Dictyocaulus viviparus]|uniref:Uncharacterized protein n=1 Tax=Dictyocaulus viviparus TaxID=29172 RepID=A0A0D8XBD0_DICVI|nr:hypothetical protein DICVIV_13077 [Dictyocaulus viviparus]